ncbi:MAG: beta-(1-6) glucans synthase [Proteobacteria bacterium]|nr:beta-(1-6) glucans synthase [Pseudomonadota bacterium]
MKRFPLGLFLCCATAVVLAWFWLGRPVAMPPPPLPAHARLYCISYAPFRAEQNPLVAGTYIEQWQIDEDLARLKTLSRCVRTYSVEHGLDQIAPLARRHGIKVLQGLWLSSNAEKNRVQIDTVIRLANDYADVIEGVVVGNEVLLRGELSAKALGEIIAQVKAAVPVPVTYADVWEFWLRNSELAALVDFVTVHILPYWEDDPVPAAAAAGHVDAIRRLVAARFPDKDILIGEVGWPSAGRMRAGALPSPSQQALVLHHVLAAAGRGNYHVNIIEAFDQPWKRRLEGSVGGHWGLFATQSAAPKFHWGTALSDHPSWRWQALVGTLIAAAIFVVAWFARARGTGERGYFMAWSGVAVAATAAGVLAGIIAEKVAIEGLGLGGWVQSLAWAAVAAAAAILAPIARMRGEAIAGFSQVLGRSRVLGRSPPPARAGARLGIPLPVALGLVLVALTVLALASALALIFDPRYRDFPYAPLTLAVASLLPFAPRQIPFRRPTGAGAGESESEANARQPWRRNGTQSLCAVILTMASAFIVWNETIANWQALWFAGANVVLAIILLARADARN